MKNVSKSAPSILVKKSDQSIISHSQNNNDHTKQQQRRKILPEEEYTSTLNKIITRDYYPSITSLHRDFSVLQKRSEGDTAGAIAIRKAARKLDSIEDQCQLEEEKEDMDALLNHGGIRKRPRPLGRESIDGFHARVTSEDNAYFEENMIEEVKEKKDKMDIIYGTKCATLADKRKVPLLLQNYASTQGSTDSTVTLNKNQQRKMYDESPFQSASDQFNAPVERIQAAGTTKDGKSISETNSLFFTPQHINNDSNNSSAIPELCNGDTQNDSQLMPPPPSRTRKNQSNSNDENNINNKALILSSKKNVTLTDNRHILVEYQAKPKSRERIVSSSSTTSSSIILTPSNEKQIIPENTRFEYQDKTRMVASSVASSKPASITVIPSTTRGGNSSSYETDSSINTDLDAPLRPIDEDRRARLKQIQKDRNVLVAMTPTIIPGATSSIRRRNDNNSDVDDETENDSPIITWGQIASTPLVSSGERLSQMNPGQGIEVEENDDDVSNEKTFKLPSIDSREKFARKVEAKLAKQKQRFDEAGGNGEIQSKPTQYGKGKSSSNSRSDANPTCNRKRLSSSSSSSLLRREDSLTPAARSLLERSTKGLGVSRPSSSLKAKKSSIVNARSNSALGSALRASYTPKLQKRGTSSSKSKRNASSSSLLHRATPLSSRTVALESSIGSTSKSQTQSVTLQDERKKKTSSLTSGLLNC